MKHVILFFIVAAILIGIDSCAKQETQKMNIIELNVSGIELKSTISGSLVGEIGSEGGIINFESIGKYSNMGCLSEFTIDTISNSNLTLNWKGIAPYTLCEYESWKIEILSDAPDITRVTLGPNNTASERKIFLCFGSGYAIVDVYITQLPQKK